MPPCLKLQALRIVSNKFPQKPSKAPYVPRARDNFVATGKARVTLSMCYLENVSGHRWRDVESEIVSDLIDVVQQLAFIGRWQRGILNYHRGTTWAQGCLPESGWWNSGARGAGKHGLGWGVGGAFGSEQYVGITIWSIRASCHKGQQGFIVAKIFIGLNMTMEACPILVILITS